MKVHGPGGHRIVVQIQLAAHVLDEGAAIIAIATLVLEGYIIETRGCIAELLIGEMPIISFLGHLRSVRISLRQSVKIKTLNKN